MEGFDLIDFLFLRGHLWWKYAEEVKRKAKRVGVGLCAVDCPG